MAVPFVFSRQFNKGKVTGNKKGVKVPYEVKILFLDRYKEIVYNKKYQNKMKIVPTMKTWKNEIKIYFDKSVDKLSKICRIYHET
jgi:hypothetical protein